MWENVIFAGQKFLKMRKTKYKVVSLFSGCGGLDLGIVQSGNEIIWANDNDKNAVATYRKNIGNYIVCDDIRNIEVSGIPDCDVVIGGFPCQGFSMANLKRNVDDERNQLYKSFYSVVKIKQPLFFIAENVKGILSLDNGTAIKKIIADFNEAGYNTEIHLINMADYGVPQIRQRVVIIGQRKSLGEKMLFEFPSPTNGKSDFEHPWVSIKTAIEKYPNPDEPNDYVNHVGSKYKVVFRNFTAHRPTDPEKPSPTILARGNGKGGVCAIPHYNGERRLTVRESAALQTFPDDFCFEGTIGSCYRQIGNAVPVLFSNFLGKELARLAEKGIGL